MSDFLDQSNRYRDAAGPGARKRQRERLTIENVPKKIAKPKTYFGKPSLEKHKGSNSKCRTDIRTPEASNNTSGTWCSIGHELPRNMRDHETARVLDHRNHDLCHSNRNERDTSPTHRRRGYRCKGPRTASKADQSEGEGLVQSGSQGRRFWCEVTSKFVRTRTPVRSCANQNDAARGLGRRHSRQEGRCEFHQTGADYKTTAHATAITSDAACGRSNSNVPGSCFASGYSGRAARTTPLSGTKN